MSTDAIDEPPRRRPASAAVVDRHASALIALAARHGITRLAYASPGRLRGAVDDEHDLFDMFEFQRAASDLVDADIVVLSEGALANEHVSPDLRDAAAL